MNPNVDLTRFTRGPSSPASISPAGLVSPPRRIVARYVVPGLLLAGFALLGAYSMRDTLAPVAPVRVVMPVHVAAGEAAEEAGAPVFQAPGWVEPDPFPVIVSALTPGNVARVHVLEGSAVAEGDPIVDLVDDDARIAVDQAEAALERAKAEHEAARSNWDNPIKIEETLHSAEAESERLQATLADSARALELARQQAEIDRELSRGGALGTFSAIQTQSALRAAEIGLVETKARLAATSATLAAARRNAELRIEDRQRLAITGANVRDAEAHLAAARLRLQRTRITAPTSGTVMRLYTATGATLSMEMENGMRVCSLYDPSHIQARAEVPLAEAAKVRPDLHAEIRVEAMPDRAFRGVLTRIVHEADIQRNTLPVKVRIIDPDPALKPEMVVRVQFVEPPKPAEAGDKATAGAKDAPLFLPAALASAPGGDAAVWVVAPGGRAEQRPVKWGNRTSGDLREVASGIRPTDKVVVVGAENLGPGTRVRMEEMQ